jgi:hypothetical protein
MELGFRSMKPHYVNFPMPDKYRKNAFHCVRLAQASNNAEGKLILLMMARGWINIGKLSARQSPLETDRAKADLGFEIATP